MFGITNLSIIPCRKEPSDRSEMVTQLLFGDHFQILEMQGIWCRIKTAYDDYECWIDRKQFLPIAHHSFDILNTGELFCVNELIQIITDKKTGQLFHEGRGMDSGTRRGSKVTTNVSEWKSSPRHK